MPLVYCIKRLILSLYSALENRRRIIDKSRFCPSNDLSTKEGWPQGMLHMECVWPYDKKKEPPSEIALKRISYGRVDLTKQSVPCLPWIWERAVLSLFIQRRNISPGHVSDSPASCRSMALYFPCKRFLKVVESQYDAQNDEKFEMKLKF